MTNTNPVRHCLTVVVAALTSLNGAYSNDPDKDLPRDSSSAVPGAARAELLQKSEGSPDRKTAANPVPKPVALIDGGKSPEHVLDLYLKAAIAGDHEAALLLFDPDVRSLFRTEMIVERTVIESTIVEHGSFGEPKFRIGGMLFLFAQRDIVRPRAMAILETRRVDDGKTVLTVVTTEKSYHDDGDIKTIRQFLAVRSRERWYLFRPLGTLLNTLRADESAESVIRVLRGAKTPLRESADFEECYDVPIETIHQQIVLLAQGDRVPAMEEQAMMARRQYEAAVTRLIRGDIESREHFRKSVTSATAGFTKVMEEQAELLRTLLAKLQKLRPLSETDKE